MRAKLAGKRFNEIQADIVQSAIRSYNMLVEDLTAGGYPYGVTPLKERDLYERLIALRNANAPEYWEDPTAQAMLARLAERFGPPPAPAAPPTAPFPGMPGTLM